MQTESHEKEFKWYCSKNIRRVKWYRYIHALQMFAKYFRIQVKANQLQYKIKPIKNCKQCKFIHTINTNAQKNYINPIICIKQYIAC